MLYIDRVEDHAFSLNDFHEVHEIYNFVRTFLGSLSDLCLGVEKNISLRNTLIFHFLSQNYLPLGVGGHEIYKFLSPYTTDAHKLIKGYRYIAQLHFIKLIVTFN